MKILGTLGIALLLLLVAGPARVFSQDADRPGQAQEEKTKPNDKEKEKDKDKDKGGAMQEERRDKDQPGMKQDEHRDHPQEQQEQKGERNQQRTDQREDQKMDKRMEHNEHQHPAAAKGQKIPDDKFKKSFGRDHTFKVQRTEIINNSQPVIVYGGYNFQLVEAWPTIWGFDDPVYVDYDPYADQYFLIDTFHPDVRVSVLVVGGF